MVRKTLCGWLLFAALSLSILVGFGAPLSPLLPGCLAWLVAFLLFGRLGRVQQFQTLAMLAVGLVAAAIGLWRDVPLAALVRGLYANHVLIAMLAAVTFLRLVTTLQTEPVALPKGRAALWRTLLGVHLFGAVINMSAVFIIGDRLARRGRLSSLQARVLSRGFSLAAHWSPFFVAMGVALTQAPGSQLVTLSLVGLVPAAIGLGIAGAGLVRLPGAATLRGYPMQLKSLATPVTLALGVFLLRFWLPGVGVITLVSALSLLVTALLLLWQAPRQAAARWQAQVVTQLPRMGGEVVLFLSAGVLSVGISMLVTGWGVSLAGMPFGPLQAALLLWLIVGLAVLGIHPLISIATSSGIIGTVGDPNLLAMTYLMTWALGVAASPLSGMHMALQGRYGVPAYRFVGWNGRYVLLMLLVDSAVLFAYTALTAA